MAIKNLIKIKSIKEFAEKVSGKYFYIIKTYGNKEYVIQIEEDKNTEYDFVIPFGLENHVIFKIIGNIDKKKKYRAFLLNDVLIIYEPKYYENEFKDIIKTSIELQEEKKKIEELFNQLKSVLTGGIPAFSETQTKQIEEKRQRIIQFEKEQDKEVDLDQFYNIVEEVYKDADIEKRYKRIKLLEKAKEVEEKEKEYGLKDEDVENMGDDDE